ELQQALGPDRRLDFRVVDERRRSAEVAVLADPLRIEHADRLAALALNGPLLDLPAARRIGQLAQRLGQVVLDDRPRRRIDGEGRRRTAERADEELLRRIPFRLRTAGGARML